MVNLRHVRKLIRQFAEFRDAGRPILRVSNQFREFNAHLHVRWMTSDKLLKFLDLLGRRDFRSDFKMKFVRTLHTTGQWYIEVMAST